MGSGDESGSVESKLACCQMTIVSERSYEQAETVKFETAGGYASINSRFFKF